MERAWDARMSFWAVAMLQEDEVRERWGFNH